MGSQCHLSPAGARVERDDGPLLPAERLDRHAPRNLRAALRVQVAPRHRNLGRRLRTHARPHRGGQVVNRDLATKVADAVLYEGYMLYPYRRSALKNRQRWTFGILYPPSYHEVRSGTERARMHSECLLIARGAPKWQFQLRFLHLLTRQVMRIFNDGVSPVPSLVIDGRLVESWDEGEERTVELDTNMPLDMPARVDFHFPATHTSEALRDTHDAQVAIIERI